MYGVQAEYSRLRERYRNDLPGLGYTPPGDDDVDGWIVLMHLARSIGYAGVKRLLQGGSGSPVARIAAIGDGRVTAPGVGVQSAAKVKMRARRSVDLPSDAKSLAAPAMGWPSGGLNSLPPRDDQIQDFDADAVIARVG